MRNKVSKNLLMTVLLTIFVVAILGISFAYTTIYNSVSTDSYLTIDHISESGNAIVFSVTRNNNDANVAVELNLKVKVTEVSNNVNASQLKAALKYGMSSDNITNNLGTINLTVGSDTQILNLGMGSTTMYFSVSFYDGNTLLNLDEENIKFVMTAKDIVDFNYQYTNTSQVFTAPYDGEYYVELWGAAGNYYPQEMQDQVGKGAYTAGKITLTAGDKLYIYTGQNAIESGSFYGPSFNNGSSASGATDIYGNQITSCGKNGDCHNSSSGGGATDVRLVGGSWDNQASLESRIMVAAGGGGTQRYSQGANQNNGNVDLYVEGVGGSGGGLVGYNAGLKGNYFGTALEDYNLTEADGLQTYLGYGNDWINTAHDYTFGGRQKDGGLTNPGSYNRGQVGSFGKGGNGQLPDSSIGNQISSGGAGGSGGGGYYGGAGGGITEQYTNNSSGVYRTSLRCHSPGAGGSSFIAGHAGSISIQNANNSSCVEQNYRPENYVGTTNVSCSYVTNNAKDRFTDTVMIDGEGYVWTNVRTSTRRAMPTPPRGGTNNAQLATNGYGNIGSGAARITYLSTETGGTISTWTKSGCSNLTKGEMVAEFAKQYITKMKAKQAEFGTASSGNYVSTYGQDTNRVLGYSEKSIKVNTPDSIQVNSCVIAFDCASFVDYVYTKSLCLTPGTIKGSYSVSQYCTASDCSPYPATVSDLYSDGRVNSNFTEIYSKELNHSQTNSYYTNFANDLAAHSQPGDVLIIRRNSDGAETHSFIYVGKINGEDRVAEYSMGLLKNGNDGYNLSTMLETINRNNGANYTYIVLRYKNADSTVDSSCTPIAKIPTKAITKPLPSGTACEDSSHVEEKVELFRIEANNCSSNDYKVTVHHYKQGTTENPQGCTDPAVQTIDEGEGWTTSACTPTDGYELLETPSNATGTSISGDVEVIYYYFLPKYKLTVQHLALAKNELGQFIPTETKVFEPDTVTEDMDAGTNYNVSNDYKSSNELKAPYTGKYEHDSNMDTDTEGVIIDDTVAKLYYKPKSSQVIVRYYLQGTTVHANTEDVDYTYQTNVNYLDTFNIQPSTHTIAGVSNTPTVTIPNNYNFDSVTVTGATNTTTTTSTVTGTINDDTVTVTYYYTRSASLRVQHFAMARNEANIFAKTETKVFEPDSVDTTVTDGASYDVRDQYKDSNSLKTPYTGKYEHDQSQDSYLTGNIDGDTVVKFYYKPKASRVTVKFLEKNSTTFANSEQIDYVYGDQTDIGNVYINDTFDITPDIHLVAGVSNNPTVTLRNVYVFDSIVVTGASNVTKNGTNVKGTIDGTDVTIIYYYTKQVARLDVYHYKMTRTSNGTYVKTTEQAPGTTNSVGQSIEAFSNQNIGASTTVSGNWNFEVVDYTDPNGNTTSSDSEPYELIGVEPNKTYKFVFYYIESYATVESRYIDCSNDTPIASSVVEYFRFGDPYNGTQKTFTGYNYKGVRYELSDSPDRGDPAAGTISKPEYRVDYCYKKQYKIDVRYIDGDTNEELDSELYNKEDGEQFTTVEKTFTNYSLLGVDGTYEGFINATNVDANGVLHVVYKYRKSFTLTVKYIEDKSPYTNKLHEDLVETYKRTENYTATEYAVDGYHKSRVEGNLNGTIEGDTTVIIYYTPNDYDIIINYVDCDSKQSIGVQPTRVTRPYLSSYTSNKIDIDNYSYGNVESNIEGAALDQTAGTATVIVPIVDNSNPATITYCYNRKTSTLIVHHYDCSNNNNSLMNDEVQNGVKWGEDYTTTDHTIPNYIYTSDSGNTSGTVDATTVNSNNQIVVTYCYSRQNGSLTVKYLEEGSDAVVKAPHQESIDYGESYDARPYKENIPYYEFVRVSGNETGTISGNVTVTYYYRRLIGKLTIYYKDAVTHDTIATTKEMNWTLGEDYSSIPYIISIDNYTYSQTHDGPETGVMGDPTANVEVTYYYNKNTVQLIVRYLDIENDRKLCDDVTQDKTYGDKYITTQKEFDYYHFVRTDKPTTGYIYNQLVITYYYRRNTGIVRTYYRDVDDQREIANREDQVVPYESTYTTIEKSISKYDKVRIDGNPSDTLLSDEVEVTYYYQKKKGKVITQHFDRTNNTQFGQDIVDEYKLDEHYETHSIEIPNYELVATPDAYVGTVTSTTPIYVKYYYDQLKGVVIIRYLDEDTKEELQQTQRIGYNYGQHYTVTAPTIDNYTLSRVAGNESGEVGEEQIIVTYYYKINVGKLTVEHLEQGTNRNLKEPTVTDYPYGTNYLTHREVFENYEFVNFTGSERGIINGNIVVRYFYRLKDATITVNYVEEGNPANHVKDTEVYNVKWGDDYLFNSVRIENFDYIRSDGDPDRGTVAGNIVINYYYKRKPANLVVHHLETGTERILANEDRETVYYGLPYNTSSKDIEGYKKDASHSPTNDHGIVNGDIEVTYYYDRKDADVVITYVDRADITNPFLQITDGYNYGDTYTTEQREFAGYEYVDHDGALTGKVTKDHTYVTYYYERQVGNITVKYLDEIDLHELYQTSSIPMNYGEQYTTDEREFAGYELSRIDGRASGTVDGDKIIIYYYKKKAATVTVNYIDFVTQEELHSPTIINYKYGDSYQTDKLNIKDYDYLMVDGIESGTVDDDNIVVTYYYERHQAIVVSHYVEEGTNNVLAEPQTHEVGLGKYYSTNLPGSIPADYELVRKTDNYEGIARQDRIDVYYYYRKANSDLTTKITKVGNSEITDLENNVDYEIIYEANVNNYRGSATLTIIDKLPYKIDLSLSNLDGGVYNPYKNTIEWNIVFEDNDEDYEHESLDTYLDPKLDTIQVSKYVSLKYIGVDPTERNMINTVTGKLKLSNNTQEISNNLSTKISIPGSIIVHHYNIETGEELIPEEYNEGLVGETFISHPHDFEGYKVVTRPSNETLVFNEGEQEVIYEYERIKFNVQVSVVGGIGEATGNEEIFYGDDSTEGYIVITPGEGYEIEKIVVNGVSYDIYDREGMTLENFINVQENIDIEVEFSEVAIPVPITGKTSKYIIIASIMIILSIMYVAYNKGLITKLLKR